MIIESRKWRLLSRALILLLSTALILAYSGLASYALQDNKPLMLSSPADLTAQKLGGRFVTISGKPDVAGSITLHRDQVTTFWLPLQGLDGTLFVVTLNDPYDDGVATAGQHEFSGKVQSFSNAPNSSEAKELYEAKTGQEVPDEAYVLMEGEKPEEFRPMVPVVAGLALIWFLSLVGFIREWRRTGRRRAAV